jgi:uncharacterized membrane protein
MAQTYLDIGKEETLFHCADGHGNWIQAQLGVLISILTGVQWLLSSELVAFIEFQLARRPNHYSKLTCDLIKVLLGLFWLSV